MGAVTRPHGVRGLVRVHLHDPASDAVARGVDLFVRVGGERRGPVRVAGRAGGAILVAVPGVEGRDAAERLRGARVVADRQAYRLAPDEFLYQDLIGCRAVEGDVCYGVVAEVFSAGASDVLVIRGGDRELMVPLVDDWVAEVDIAGREVRLVDAHLLLEAGAR